MSNSRGYVGDRVPNPKQRSLSACKGPPTDGPAPPATGTKATGIKATGIKATGIKATGEIDSTLEPCKPLYRPPAVYTAWRCKPHGIDCLVSRPTRTNNQRAALASGTHPAMDEFHSAMANSLIRGRPPPVIIAMPAPTHRPTQT